MSGAVVIASSEGSAAGSISTVGNERHPYYIATPPLDGIVRRFQSKFPTCCGSLLLRERSVGSTRLLNWLLSALRAE